VSSNKMLPLPLASLIRPWTDRGSDGSRWSTNRGSECYTSHRDRHLRHDIDTSAPLWRPCLLAFPIAMFPSAALFALAYTGLRALGVDVARFQHHEFHPSVAELLVMVVFAPLVETLMMAGGLNCSDVTPLTYFFTTV
jgi:hypothetical protein